MALPTVTIDDRTFEQLFAFMRKQIDTSEWVDHNLSDPGIALLELLCWIGEMTLYSANRVPQTHIDKFATLVLDPPQPVTVPLTLTVLLDPPGTSAVTIPAGTRFATNFQIDPSTGQPRRFVFETMTAQVFQPPLVPNTPEDRIVTVREVLAVVDETLGVSDGTPNQRFRLRPVHALLGLPPAAPTPVLTDFVNRSALYDPNPRVTVGGVAWELERFLLTEASRVDANPRNHYMVDADGAIRFGDAVFGTIPTAGAVVRCARYQILQGDAALVHAGTPMTLVDPVPGLSITTIVAAAAEGGDFFFAPDDRVREGLKRFRRPSRLITAADIEEVLLVDFNEFQARAKSPERILRAVALMNRKPSAPDQPALGHVTIVMLATSSLVASAEQLDAKLTQAAPFVLGESAAAHLAAQQNLVKIDATLVNLLERFLDKRRLITTRIHVADLSQPLPTLDAVSIAATVAVTRDRNTGEMTDTITARLREFLGVTGGGFAGKGWPLGGSVYRSKIFRLLEGIDGVDHVESLALSPADANGDVALGPLSLPAIALNGLAISVVRA
jgi:predicted phage baseplate assembly protein